ISHDHYDHLDSATIHALAHKIPRFFVPLGVGSHLEYWGVDPANVTELDWWDTQTINGVAIHATPARHFSGRGLHDRDATLWASWSLIGPKHRAFFSGDTAMFPGFKQIGDRLGPFDVTMIESGAYNRRWVDVHLGPEQAVQAHIDLQGRLLMPVHWGTFDLALHGWTEPAERLLAAATDLGVTVAVPKPGGSVEPGNPPPAVAWWPDIPWTPVAQDPVFSTGLPPRPSTDPPR
ncbi:MAG: MBL fold metallo-hydrolase, partial [Nannocystaceae bacterium]